MLQAIESNEALSVGMTVKGRCEQAVVAADCLIDCVLETAGGKSDPFVIDEKP